MLNFLRQAFFSYKGANNWANWPAFISSTIVAPGFTVAVFALTGKFARSEAAAQDYVAGMSIIGASFAMMGGFLQTFTTDRQIGTISFFLAARGSRLVAFLARPLF